MKKKIHEVLEDFAFQTHNEQERVDFYRDLLSSLKTQTKKIIDDTIQSSVLSDFEKQNVLGSFEDDSWRIFSKPIIADSFLLSFQYMLTMFHRFGRKVFELDGDLADALYNTDISIAPDDIHFPFKNFILYLNNSKLVHISKEKVDGVWQFNHYIIEYVMVDFIEYQSTKVIRFVLGHCDPGADKENLESWNNTTIYDCQISGDKKLKIKGGELQQILPKDKHFTAEEVEEIKKYNEAMLNFLLSFALYVTHRPDDLEIQKPRTFSIQTSKPKKLRRLLKEMENESHYAIHYIGSKYAGSFKNSRIYAHGHGITLDHRIIVRGHWRQQWFGKRIQEGDHKVRGQDQKLIWIEPFYKGEDLDQFRTDVYKVMYEKTPE